MKQYERRMLKAEVGSGHPTPQELTDSNVHRVAHLQFANDRIRSAERDAVVNETFH
jgi:hypothetical protein